MSDNLTGLYVQTYKGNVQLLLQQKGSRLRGSVTEGSGYVGEKASPVDQFGNVEALRVGGRFQPIQFSEVPNDRRWVFPQDYDLTMSVDTFDKLRLLEDPTSSYSTDGVYAMGRAIDDVLIAGIFGPNKTGQNSGTTVNFPSGQQISASLGATAATGLNVAKLKKGMEMLLAAEADLDNDPVYMPISAKQNTDLMNEIQVINGDYQALGASVQDGRLKTFMGINFLHSERLLLNGSGQRRCPMYLKSGVHLAIWSDATQADISQRKDMRGLPWQLYFKMTLDATRLEEKKVIEIPCVEV